ncbi:DUF4270 family protein [Pontibacter harenae]|uniref:DUF4270 family protein n=1 Tax=Pontibacter harenae TaxID=2894083 RepID=UPI001E3B1572|nr:DUF4270 family protein [Pontibacter harenae]MCC9165312.1 DUF4270 domain-containing protein [Pontibacter harenae]
MNLAARRFLLFFFSIATLASCEDPTEIGLNLQDENQIGTSYTDTFSISTGTVLLNDSILSFRQQPALIGRYTDPVLGSITTNTFTQLGLNGSTVMFGSSDNPAVADSLVLTLDYSTIYGNRDSDISVSVHRLQEGFDEKTSYFTNSALAYEETPLGSSTFRPRLIPIKRNNVEVDSAVLVKIKLDPALANELVSLSGTDPLRTQENFNNYLKGLAFITTSTTSGSVIGINLTSTNTRLRLHYKTGTEVKHHDFRFATSGLYYFNNVVPDRTGTAVADLQTKGQYLSAEETNGDSYVQANTQLLTKLMFPSLNKFKEEQGNIIVNRAELIIPVKAASTNVLAPSPQLVLYEATNANRIATNSSGTPLAVQLSAVGAANTTSYPAPVAYNSEKSAYTINVTSYVQNLLMGQKQNNGLLLSPGVSVAVSGQSTRQIVTEPFPYRAVISNTEAQPVKLRLYFSKLQ